MFGGTGLMIPKDSLWTAPLLSTSSIATTALDLGKRNSIFSVSCSFVAESNMIGVQRFSYPSQLLQSEGFELVCDWRANPFIANKCNCRHGRSPTMSQATADSTLCFTADAERIATPSAH
jgi:hypothetical protein